MASDVLAYQAEEVPVGDDQRQHVELMRDIAHASTPASARAPRCVVPQHRIPGSAPASWTCSIPSKMSTTGAGVEGTVYVPDEPSAIEKKLKSAVTDSGSEVRRERTSRA